VFIAGLSFQSAASAAVKQYATVTKDVNVRGKASTSSKKLGVLKKGTKVTVYAKTKYGWAQIVYNSKKAYIYSSYLHFYTSAKAVSYKMNTAKKYVYKDNFGDTVTYTFAGVNNGWNQWYENNSIASWEKEDAKGLYTQIPFIKNSTSTDLKYPIKVGEKWLFSSLGGTKAYATVTGINKTVKVKAGTFQKVIVVNITDGETTEINFFAPSVGMIKSIINVKGDDQSITMELAEIKKN
jgi:uncharacterized protein YraI